MKQGMKNAVRSSDFTFSIHILIMHNKEQSPLAEKIAFLQIICFFTEYFQWFIVLLIKVL